MRLVRLCLRHADELELTLVTDRNPHFEGVKKVRRALRMVLRGL